MTAGLAFEKVLDIEIKACYYFGVERMNQMDRQNSCGGLIKQIHDALERNANNAMRPMGMTMAQFGVLLALHCEEDGTLSLKALEQSLRVAQSTAAGIVARLEQKKLVESFGDPEDRRVKLVRITVAGEACCCQAEKNMEQTERELLSGLTEAERDILLVLLRKMRDTLQ